MAEIWKPLSIETYQSWHKAIVDEASDELNDWESSFIESIGTRLAYGNNLSESQARNLERIYSEKTK